MTTVAELIVDALVKSGVKRIYGLPGDSLNPLMDAIRRNTAIEFIQVRHEEGAALAASFEAKYTGDIAVCMGTSGPGSIHLLNGLYDAKMEASPVLALTGQIETDLIGTDYFQEVDMMHLYSDVSVFQARIINPDSAGHLVKRAIFEARTHPGVTHLDLPVDILRSQAKLQDDYGMTERPAVTMEPDLGDIGKAIDQSQRPVIMYGRGAAGCADGLKDLSTRIGAPLIYALNGKGILSDMDPRVMGGLGLLGTKPSVAAMKKADLVILIGTSFPYVQFLPDGVKFIQVDSNPLKIGKRVKPDLYCVCHADIFLKKLKVQEKQKKYYDDLSQEKEKWLESLKTAEGGTTDPIKPEAVVSAVSSKLEDNAVIVADTGNVTVWAARNLRLKEGHRFLFSSWLGTMGAGVPGAIGTSFASGRPVLAIVGDGSFAMTMMELITARKYSRPVKYIVFNNSKLGMIKFEEEVMGYPEFGVDLYNPDFEALAKSIEIEAFTARKASELDAALTELMAAKGPAVLNVFVDSDERPMPPKINLEQAKGYVTSILREKFSGI